MKVPVITTGAKNLILMIWKTWRCDTEDSTPGRFEHLIGAIQLLKLRRTNIEVTKANHDLHILVIESVLFHVSTLKAFDPFGDAIDIDDEMWEWMGSVLQMPAHEKTSPVTNHPVLGTPWALNKLVFNISRLGTNLSPMTSDSLLERERLEIELSRWERDEEDPSNTYAPTSEDPYASVRKLYIICARVLLLKLESASGDSAEAFAANLQVHSHKARAMAILQDMADAKEEIWNFLMRWPLHVLGYITEETLERSLIRDSLEKLWLSSLCGDVRRLSSRIQKLWDEDQTTCILGSDGSFGVISL